MAREACAPETTTSFVVPSAKAGPRLALELFFFFNFRFSAGYLPLTNLARTGKVYNSTAYFLTLSANVLQYSAYCLGNNHEPRQRMTNRERSSLTDSHEEHNKTNKKSSKTPCCFSFFSSTLSFLFALNDGLILLSNWYIFRNNGDKHTNHDGRYGSRR